MKGAMKILFATSEAQPLVKTGGLADVSGSLPVALQQLGHDVRIVLPAYRCVLEQVPDARAVSELSLPSGDAPVRVLRSDLPGSAVPLYLIDSPLHFDRPGNPYTGPDGSDWPDNGRRFATFARAVQALAQGRADGDWSPEIVHCNDWQTGLVPALLALEDQRPATLFTIHNLAYQGLFSWDEFQRLSLPYELWSMHAMEFHGQLSFIKGGLAFADRLTTVSPTYAREICTPQFGAGLHALLNHRRSHLHGILNGVDYSVWNPSTDPYIPQHYSNRSLGHKTRNRKPLLERFGMIRQDDAPVIGMVGRLVHQKGVDLVLAVLQRLLAQPVQMVVLGSGQAEYEQALLEAAERHDNLGVKIGYDEELAHLLEAGSDLFLMPSRFEPCGLNQLYSLRFGTVPVVRRTGGLADTVVDADLATLRDGSATGFVFDGETPDAFYGAVQRALCLYTARPAWRQLMHAGMRQDFSWERSARGYVELYREALSAPYTPPAPPSPATGPSAPGG